ncbi:MAG: YcjX family protein [Candidatus Adiutrix sp.]|jgi:predicted YcjX-like family ATPase|nr:YcjX family protein [Candidatus Adiutrix sp.]
MEKKIDWTKFLDKTVSATMKTIDISGKVLNKVNELTKDATEIIHTPNIKVAVTGLQSSGKTVFILSLLQHIKYFQAERFPLIKGDDKYQIHEFKELPVPSNFEPFPFKEMWTNVFAAPEGKEWPNKTTETYLYSASFKYSGQWFANGKIKMDLLDFPGERFADVEIARSEDYVSWSDKIIDQLKDEEKNYNGKKKVEDKKEYVKKYLDEIKENSLSRPIPQFWIESYKKLMTLLKIDIRSNFITPSSFLLDYENKSMFSAENDEPNNGRDRFCGLRSGEFVPLPADIRDKYPAEVADMGENYSVYREKVVKKLFDYLNECSHIILTVDILGTLYLGVQRYNSLTDILMSWGEMFKPNKIFSLSENLKKLAVVGTKKDMTVTADHPNMNHLLEQIKTMLERQHKKIKYASFCVSAWRSTTDAERYRYLIGKRARHRAGETIELRADGQEEWPIGYPVPKEWPADWDPGYLDQDKPNAEPKPKFVYPLTKPSPIKNTKTPPDQSGMGDVFLFIVD